MLSELSETNYLIREAIYFRDCVYELTYARTALPTPVT